MLLEELVVTEVKARKGKLFLNVRNVGEFYFPFWMHKFPSRIFGKKGSGKRKARDLERELAAHPELKAYPRKVYATHFDCVVQQAPISFAKTMKALGFITGHYPEEARWYFAKPGDMLEVDERVIAIGERRDELNEDLRNYSALLRSYLERSFSEKEYTDAYKKGAMTGVLKAIEEHLQEKDVLAAIKGKKGIKKVAKEVDAEIIAKRKAIQEDFNQLQVKLQELHKDCFAELFIDAKEQVVDVNLDSTDYFTKQGPVPLAELKKERWCVLDIEIPLWRKSNAQISWNDMAFLENNEVVDRICVNLHGLEQKIDDVQMVPADDEKDLGRKSADLARPCFVFSAYNATFDYENLGNIGKDVFIIGERMTDPKVVVSLPFFRRDEVRGKFIIDPMRWARTAFSYLPNQKMEMIAKHLFGDACFSKSLDYDQMEDLEMIALHGDFSEVRRKTKKKINSFLEEHHPERMKEHIQEIEGIQRMCSEMIASYVNKDVDILVKMLQSEAFEKNFEDYVWMANHFDVEVVRLMHSPRTINDRQEHRYFDALGVLRDTIYLPTKDMRAKDSAAKAAFTEEVLDLVKEGPKHGMYRKVYKLYMPLGDYLRDEICVNFEEAKTFFTYKYQFMEDKQRQFFLSRFSEALANFIIVDYAVARQERKKLEDMIGDRLLSTEKEANKQGFLAEKEYRMLLEQKMSDFQGVYFSFINTLDRWGKDKLCEDVRLSLTKTEEYLSRDLDFLIERGIMPARFVEQIKGNQEFVNTWIREHLSDYARKHATIEDKIKGRKIANSKEREFWLIIHQLARVLDKEDKVTGNYSNFRNTPKRVITVHSIRNTLENKVNMVNEFIEKNTGK